MKETVFKTPDYTRIYREPETKTIYVNSTHLKEELEIKYQNGGIDPYNIGFYSLKAHTRNFIKGWESLGYKTVFKIKENKVVLIRFNRDIF